MADPSLVRAAANGDHAAFAVLVQAALPRLDAAARFMVRDPGYAQDAVQDALVRAWRDLPSLRDPDRFDAWVYRLTVRSCLDQLRTRRRRVEVELPAATGGLVPDGSASAAERDEIERGLARLSPDQRALVVLRFYLDLTLADAADALGIPLGTAKSRLHRALAELRTSLAPLGPIPATPAQEPLA